jgi:hypothetical protein
VSEDVHFVLTIGNIKAGQLTEPITLFLSFIVSPNNTFSPVLPSDTTSTPTSPAADPQAEMSSVVNALQSANEAMARISLSDTWEIALERIKWVMDTVSPVAEVRYDVLS